MFVAYFPGEVVDLQERQNELTANSQPICGRAHDDKDDEHIISQLQLIMWVLSVCKSTTKIFRNAAEPMNDL